MNNRHPALTELDNMLDKLAQLPEDRQPAAFDALKKRISDEKTGLFQRLLRNEDDPARMEEKDIQRMHDLEIMSAYLQSSDPENPVARHRVGKAIEWRTPCGHLTLAGQFKRSHDNATAGDSAPRESVTIKVDHGIFR